MIPTNFIILMLILCTYKVYSQLKVGVITNGNATDLGWVSSQMTGIEDTKALYGETIHLDYVTTLNFLQCFNASNAFAAAGYELVFILDNNPNCAGVVAQMYPNVSFVVLNDVTLTGINNLAVVYKGNDLILARFVLGVLAAKQSGVQKICFMIPSSFLATIRYSNAILMGIAYARPNDYHLLVGNTVGFDDPVNEQKVLEYFFNNASCDLVIQQLTNIRVMIAVTNAGKYGIGYPIDQGQILDSDLVLTSMVIDWLPMFVYFIEKKLSDIFVAEVYSDGFDEGALFLTPYSPLTNRAARVRADNTLRKLLNDKLDPKCGKPVKDTYGTKCINENVFFSQYLNEIEIFNPT